MADPDPMPPPAAVAPTGLPPSAKPAYPIDWAVADAIAHNPTLAVAGADLATAGFQRDAAEWGRFPTVAVEVSPGLYSSGSSPGASRSFRIDQPLYTFGRITGQIDAAKAVEKSAGFGVSEARRSIAEQAAAAYVVWLGATERLQVAVEARGVFEKLLQYVQHRLDAGAAASSDVSVARARLEASLVQRAELEGELVRAASDLRAVVAGDIGRPVAVDVPPFPIASPDDVERLYVDNSSVLSQRQADVEAAKAAVKVSQGEALPQVLLRLQRTSSSVNGSGVPPTTQLGVALEYTPQPGLAALSSIHAAESRILSAQAKVQAQELDIRSRARSNLADFHSATTQLADLAPQIAQLRATAESYMRQFEAGKRTWIDVLNAYRELLDTQVSLSRARTGRDQSAVHLMANTGSLLPWIDTLRH